MCFKMCGFQKWANAVEHSLFFIVVSISLLIKTINLKSELSTSGKFLKVVEEGER